MKKQILSEEVIREYVAYLHQEEYASQTIEKYERAVRAFRVWLTDAEVDREAVNAYKEYLQEPNSHLAHQLLHTTYTAKQNFSKSNK